MRLIKRLVAAVVALVVLLVVCVVVAVASINTLARKGVEAGATYALGVETTVSSVDVGLVSARVSMASLNVANPQGFSAPHFLALGKGGLAVSLGSLTRDVVEVPSLSLDDLDVALERNGGDSNYKRILDHLSKVQGAGEPAPPSSGGGKRFVIRDLSIRRINIHLDLAGLPGPASVVNKLTKINIPIDEIKMQNVGKTGSGVNGTGVTLSQLSSLIVQAIMAAAIDKGGGLIPGEVLGELRGGLGNLSGLGDAGLQVLGNTQGTIETLAGQAQGAAKEGGKALESVGKGIQGMLGGGQNDKQGKK